MSTLTIQLPDKLNDQLTIAARKLRVSPARLVIQTIELHLTRAAPASAASLYERSRDLCGSVKGTPRDLARNQRHLKGYGSWKR
jgi:hypothetical protein